MLPYKDVVAAFIFDNVGYLRHKKILSFNKKTPHGKDSPHGVGYYIRFCSKA